MASANNRDNNNNGPPFNPAFGASGVPLTPFAPQPSFYPMQPQMQLPMTAMPGMYPNMVPAIPPMMPPAPIQTVYPPGQGPLADRPTTRGANGLLQPPEPEGPETHEASDFVRLNPVETNKYLEYWSDASDGAETLSGTHAVAFLSRASKVSKGQLRRIWDVADHRQEGFLDQTQFFIALRLLALAQRGAELSTAGLRNFTGIQLIPKIEAPPKPASPPPPSPPPNVIPTEQLHNPSALSFSWTITQDVADRFDKFFADLVSPGATHADAGTSVPFFVKSGLPRPTLKKIWQLADYDRDGMLSREEFRTAMHLVTALRNKRVAVENLPNGLDPTSATWVRIAGAVDATEDMHVPVPGGGQILQPLTGSHTGSHMMQPQAQGQMGSPIVPMPPPPPQSQFPTGASQAAIVLAPPPPPPPTQALSPPRSGHPEFMEPPAPEMAGHHAQAPAQAQAVVGNYDAEREERERMLDAMRREREEMDRARREMEAMRSEMERLRVENANLSSSRAPTAAQPPPLRQQATPVVTMGAVPTAAIPRAMAPPMMTNTAPSAAALAPMGNAVPTMLAKRLGLGIEKGTNTAMGSTIASAQNGLGVSNGTGGPDAKPVSLGMTNAQPFQSGADEDDLWDQPSPKASAMPVSGAKAALAGDNDNKDASSDSSDDDDDDFWGGMGPKPTLGAAGSRQVGTSGGGTAGTTTGKGFGGSELDDWAF